MKYDDASEHFHQWSPGAWGPSRYADGEGRYAQCSCGAQCFVGVKDGKMIGIYYSPDRSLSKVVPVEALA